jgi:flagellin
MDKDVTIDANSAIVLREVLAKDSTYEVVSVPAVPADRTNIVANSDLTSVDQLVKGNTFTMTANFDVTGSFEARKIDANNITNRIEAVQKKINTSRVQAGSQYAALESAVNYTTDLTAQYELAYNTVHDVNFSMETAHLAKNQILQQAATAMLAQANQGQQGLLQLIQG